MRDQFKAMQAQIALQETAMRQWLVFENWNHARVPDGTGGFTLSFSFDIVNPTSWPLMLVTTALWIDQEGGHRDNMKNHYIELAPKERHRVEMDNIPLDDNKYLTGGPGVTFMLYGAVSYLDCFERRKNLIFSGVVWCYKDRQTTFHKEWSPNNPYGQERKQASKKAEDEPPEKAN